MNWTEGSLARHSRGRQRNALIARQKQHFAKVRNNLLSGRVKQGPVKISFLPSESSSESPNQAPSDRNNCDGPSPPLELIKEEPTLDYPTRLHDDSHEISPTILDRRRRLLEKPDWAGLELQKPLDISFPGQVYAERRWARVSRPPERTPNELKKHAAAHGENRYERLTGSHMRIRIGSQEVRSSIATGSQLSTKRYTLEPEPKRQARLRRRDLVSECSPYVDSAERQRHGYTSIVSNNDSRASLSRLNCPETPINVVYSSSVIHEPAPRRMDNFQVLQWSPSGSDDRGSMQVEIGQPVQSVPHSQESEQQRWKDWVLAGPTPNHPSNSPLTIMDNTEIYTKQSRSSVLSLPSHLQRRLPSLHLSSEADIGTGHDSPEYVSTEKITRNRGTPGDDWCLPEEDDLLPSNRQCTPVKKPDDPDGPDDPDNLNNIWMKFACGDGYDSEELLMDAFKDAAHQAAVELRPSDTCSSAGGYTENTAACRTELSSIGHWSECDATSHESSSESHLATKGTTGSDIAYSNIATVGSTKESPRDSTRFVMPKAFIGKYATTDKASIARPFVVKIPGGGRKARGNRRKIAADGRPDIRNLPNFEGDPIEEMEDE
ncbi:hypothetical protein F4803DRAFT_171340 [Xylaria telfairii]|nr:hypothetical protein F4803DRAFT_171340 [Xylaria telfairii]